MKAIFFITILIFTSLSSFAKDKKKKIFRNLFITVAMVIVAVSVSAGNEPIPTQKCLEAYNAFYASDTIDVRIYIGYLDHHGTNFNSVIYNKIIKYIAATPCTKGDITFTTLSNGRESYDFACEFTSEPNRVDHFFKTITGPDGRPRMVKLKIINAAVSEKTLSLQETLEEKTDLHHKQLVQSQKVLEYFYDGIRKADVVIYGGHSRDGGGPDFFPPRKLWHGGTDYKWYQDNHPGLDHLINALEQRDHLKLLSIFSCKSNRYFSEYIPDDIGFISNEYAEPYDSIIHSVLGTLEGILGMQCKEQFLRSLGSRGKIIANFL